MTVNSLVTTSTRNADYFYDHSAERWANCVVPVIASDIDPRTIIVWARITNTTPGILRVRCRAVGVRPKASLDFARLLRAIVRSRGNAPQYALNVLHERTLRRMLAAGGIADPEGHNITVEGYLSRQRLVMSQHAVAAVRRLVCGNDWA